MLVKTMILSILLAPLVAAAHPVAFRNATGIMGGHSSRLSHHQINHSFRHWFASGIHHIKEIRPTGSRKATFASANFLVKRWNGNALQANLYNAWGLGRSDLGGPPQSAAYGMIQFDIEDRNYYFLTKHLRVFNRERNDLAQTKLRAGFAPYVAKFNGIHAWLILEWEQSRFFTPRPDHIQSLTPLLRIFYKTLLFEIGQSFDGITKFNYITHF